MATDELSAHRLRVLESYRQAVAAGLDCWIELLPPGEPLPCSAAASQAGVRFGDSDTPLLPLPGCDRRRYGCACCLTVQTPPTPPLTPKQVETLDGDYDAALARMSPPEASATKSFVSAVLRAFGGRSGRAPGEG